jgi:CheY-like chemotaxis protein
MKVEINDPVRAYVEQIIASSERAAHLTNSLLAFSRKQLIDLRPVNLNDIIRRVEKLLCRVIGEDIEMKTRLTDADLSILADSIQIEQVLMNLAANARDAMPDGGALLIETELMELGEEFVRVNSYGRPGPYACLSVTDTGIGMDEKTRQRIFEPFFTTKDVGKGTGLGLSMVYGIIKQHNGYINVFSEPGKGAAFKTYLPLIRSATEELQSKGSVAVLHRGTETVLLAEDDDAVRDLTRNILEDYGYQVIEAVDGEDAIRIFMANKDRIDLLVLDIIMPKKNGKDAYLEIKKVRADIKVLFTSGYTADIIYKKGILETGLDFVLKPITPADLLNKMREVLDGK